MVAHFLNLSFKNRPGELMVSGPTCKLLGSCHACLHDKKKSKPTKNQQLFLDLLSRIVVTEKTAALKTGQTEDHSLYGAETQQQTPFTAAGVGRTLYTDKLLKAMWTSMRVKNSEVALF